MWVLMQLLWFVLSLTEVRSLRSKANISKLVLSRSSQVPSPAICVGSDDQCDGNECCPGFDGSLHKTFPCPNADDNFQGCETNIKYDLYNASLMDFSNVVYDRLSAETEGNDGEALMYGVAYWSGQRLDMKIQAVNDDGSRTSLDSASFNALKPQENGNLLRFNFLGTAHGRLKFLFGVDQDGDWTPIALPWLTITLMDFDCSNTRDDCEKVTSAEHSYYEAGSYVSVGVDGSDTVFQDTIISGGSNNPHSVVLTDEQQNVSVGLMFEGKSEFTLGMNTNAKNGRNILVAGICNIQWPEIYTPAPTPVPTPVPTPSPSPAPTSENYVPSPTPAIVVEDGLCFVSGTCVHSPNYPLNYGSRETCTIDFNSEAILHVDDFATENNYDTLVLDGTTYTGLAGPDQVAVTSTSVMSWETDFGTTHKGWKICLDSLEERAYAIGDPHVRSITGDSFDLWRTGWSTFVKIPRGVGTTDKLLIRGDVRRYGGSPCAPSYLQQVRITGSWLGGHDLSVHGGSLESSSPFCVVCEGSSPMFLQTHGVTEFINEKGVSLRGWIAKDGEVWGPDARVELTVGDANVTIVQHTEGRGDSSNAMLDLSVSGLERIVDTIGGWLGVDGPSKAGAPPPECEGEKLSPT